MEQTKRKTAIEAIGDVPWGSHFCLFYQTKEDLIEILVPYFKAGLENNESCMWITSEPLSAKDAKRSLKRVVKNLDDYIEKGQIEILDYRQWYTKSGKFDADKVLQGWVEKENQAANRGFDGLRLTGNTCWLEKEDWREFTAYEARIDRVIGQYRMLALCTYSLDRCGASEVIDVVSNHELALIRRQGEWETIQSAKRKRAEEALHFTRFALDNAVEAMVCLSQDARYIDANDTFCRSVGYSREELLSMTAHDIDPYHSATIWPEFWEKLKQSGSLTFESCHRTKDGKVFPVEVAVTFFEYKGKEYHCGFARDITERKRAEEQIQILSRFPAENPNPVLRIAPEGVILYANDASEPLLATWNTQIGQVMPEDGRMQIAEVFKSGQRREIEVRCGQQIFSCILAPMAGAGYVNVYGRDITERKQAEESLKAERQRLHDVLEAMPIMVCLLTPDYHVAFANRAFREKFGESHGRLCYEYCFGKEERCDFCEAYRVLETGKPHHWQVTTPDGASVIDAYDFPFSDVDGSPMILEMDIDITERKKAEEKLRSSEEKFFKAFNLGPSAVFITTLEEGRFIEINKTGLDMLGYKADEIVGRTVKELGIWVDLNDRATMLGRLQKEGIVRNMEALCRRKSGELFTAIISVDTVDIGGQQFLLSTNTDITERKRAEEALREERDFSKSLLDTAQAIVLVLDNEGHIVSFNPYFEEISGYRLEEVKGQDWFSTFLPLETRQSVRELFSRAIGDIQTRGNINPVLTKDGRLREIEWYDKTLKDEKGSTIGLLAIGQDITERKRAERELQEKSAALERFTYAISHDLRSPLVTVKAFLGYLEQDLLRSDTGRIEKDMFYMRTAADKMGRSLDELLKVLRIGHIANTPVRVTFRELVEEALNVVAGPIAEGEVKVQVNDAPITLYGDRPRLVEIWQNLVENAVKFMGDQASPRIEIGAERRGGDTVFFVRDNGIGIDPGHQAKVFDLFGKIGAKSEGVGLGLALVKRIVELYRGTIWLESKGLGQGACFLFTLPGAVKNQG